MTSTSDEIGQLERRGWDALCGPDGAAFYDDLMADDGLMLFPDLVLDKQATIDAIRNAAPWERYDLAEIRVIEASPDDAIITYRAVALRSGEAEYRAVMSSSYARRAGRWRLVLHQQSP